MGQLVKYLFYLAVVAFLGLIVFAYVGDISAPQTEVTVPVEPNGS